MFKMKMLLASLMLLPAVLLAAPTERKLPIKMADMATRFQKHCPKHVKVSDNNDTLVITVTAVDHRGGFDETHAIGLKPLAGRSMTFMFDVKVDKIESGGERVHSIGKIIVGGSTQHILAESEGWQTYTFKSVKIPGNGLLKMRIALKNVSGELSIRNPRIKGDFPKVHKKKNKNRKKE
jgi:hypothetical protein